MKSYLLILQTVILVELTIVTVFAQSTNRSYELLLNRNQGSNSITLRCRNASSSLQEPQAVFFLNNSELSPEIYPAFRNHESQSGPGVITFQLKRQLEGMYSCGVGEVKSSPISLITYPTNDVGILSKRNTYFALVGDTVVLNCAEFPGALIHYYYVTWRNGSRPLFRQSVPSLRNSTFPDSVDPRYHLDPMNLSLIIEDVRMSDSIQDYHCDLRVVDPTGGSTYDYRAASFVNISLTVLSPPIITTKPQRKTVSQSENAFFRCTAKGYPLPTISWMHNGRIVTDSHRDYLVSPNHDPNESMTVTSDLRIFSTRVDWTGEVSCIATADSLEDSSISLTSHTVNTSLTVLGKLRKFDILISKNGDVIFLLELPTVYNQSIHLFIMYIDDHNFNRSYTRTTEIGFLNTKSVQYVEYSSQIVYNRFRINAGLVSEGVHGPLSTAPGVYDKNIATLCESGPDNHLALMCTAILGGCFFLLCIVLVIAICIISLRKDESSKLFISFFRQEQERINPGLNGGSDHTDGGIQNSSGRHGSSNHTKCDYKSNPVYGNMKKCLKGANLSERKYRRLKKELITECRNH